MNKYALHLAYKGTNYHGWQVQENANTVQQEINNALTTLLGNPIHTMGCGRTDTGVHATDFYTHFEYKELITYPKFIYQLNGILPNDIQVFDLILCKPNFHARFDAIARTYHYYLHQNKNPFLNDCSYYHRSANLLDMDQMNNACVVLKNYTDYTSFSKAHTQVMTNNCNIEFAKWTKRDNYAYQLPNDNALLFTIKADRFLRGMVRAIVGTMIPI